MAGEVAAPRPPEIKCLLPICCPAPERPPVWAAAFPGYFGKKFMLVEPPETHTSH
jgi:hypothetical protein